MDDPLSQFPRHVRRGIYCCIYLGILYQLKKQSNPSPEGPRPCCPSALCCCSTWWCPVEAHDAGRRGRRKRDVSPMLVSSIFMSIKRSIGFKGAEHMCSFSAKPCEKKKKNNNMQTCEKHFLFIQKHWSVKMESSHTAIEARLILAAQIPFILSKGSGCPKLTEERTVGKGGRELCCGFAVIWDRLTKS